MFYRPLFISLLVIGLSLVQVSGFSIFGIIPNLALIAVLASLFFSIGLWEDFLNLFIATLIIKFSPIFNFDLLIFFTIGILLIFLKRFLPWQPFLTFLILILFSIASFYLILVPE